MDPVNSLSGLTELLRKRIAAAATAKRDGSGPVQRGDTRREESLERPGIDALRNRVAEAIGAIDPDDPAKKHKALRLFIESTLLWQLGSAILNDPSFSDLVTDVQNTLEGDPAVYEQLSALMTGKRSASE
jgi:hypothetical protein